ncbi:MAG: hypothetical protein PUP92_08865 [Rhizonema sp. PD38]|nr:hypothetical protein [Rhizonema sp. PD38]
MVKGQKRLINIPILYDEVKKTRSVKLTDTCWQTIIETAHNQGISASEMIERWGQLPQPSSYL